jgi:hypothetical protein
MKVLFSSSIYGAGLRGFDGLAGWITGFLMIFLNPIIPQIMVQTKNLFSRIEGI